MARPPQKPRVKGFWGRMGERRGSGLGAGRVEDRVTLSTDLGCEKPVPLRSEVEHDAVDGSGQREAAHHQDAQHQVREGRCEVHHLHKQQELVTLLSSKLQSLVKLH